jgi:hypothetical protein
MLNPVFLDREINRFLDEDLKYIEIDFGEAPKYIDAKIVAEDDGIFCAGSLIYRRKGHKDAPGYFRYKSRVIVLRCGSKSAAHFFKRKNRW